MIGVTVGYAVGEDNGLDVHTGVIVGDGETTRLNPPHATLKSVTPDIQIKKNLVIARTLCGFA
jgi:hypothetical protein